MRNHNPDNLVAWLFIVLWVFVWAFVALVTLGPKNRSCEWLLYHAQDTGLAADYAAAEKQCGEIY